jgi:hypothetical protein
MHTPFSSLPLIDQQLINLTLEKGFKIQRLLDRCDDAHPAQHSLVTLTQWRKQPHIAAIFDEVIKDMEQWDRDADKYRNRDARDGLAEAAYRAYINIRRLEEASEESKQHTRAVEEFRLANQALYRATKPPAPPKPPRTPKANKNLPNQELELKPTSQPGTPDASTSAPDTTTSSASTTIHISQFPSDSPPPHPDHARDSHPSSTHAFPPPSPHPLSPSSSSRSDAGQ